jgi:hypothetical protein
MDCDIVRRRTRSGRVATQIVLFPDADVSDPENDSDDEFPANNDSGSDCESSSSEDDRPLSDLLGKPAKSKSEKTPTVFRWRKKQPHMPADITWKGKLSDPPEEDDLPITYFRRFFPQELIRLIVEQTKIYAFQEGSNFETDHDEIEQYLGILLRMGLVSMPRYRMYWSNELRFPPVADVIGRNRFFDLNRYLHFSDNSKVVKKRDDPEYDRFSKVRPMLNIIQQACLAIEPEEKMSVDEQIIPYKGKNSLRQYLPKKPKKWGFKVIARCGVSGLTYDFLMYVGKAPTVQKSCGYQSGDFVIKLCETLPQGLNFKVYFDNWFTFMELQILLKASGIYSIGTIRSNRLRACSLLKSEKELKKSGRGSSDWCVDANSGLTVVRWLDSSAVQLSSTHAAIEPMTSLKRWDRKQHKYVDVPCPAVVKEYNSHMGGVDLFDMLMALYRVDHKSPKWYRRVFLWALNLAVVNGWILYRRHMIQKNRRQCDQLDLIEFTASVSESLVKANKLPAAVVRKRGRPSLDSDSSNAATSTEDSMSAKRPQKRMVQTSNVNTAARFDSVGHFPAHSEPKQRCKVCHSYVRMACIKCECHLCVTKDKNCFIRFHQA